MLKIAIIGRPNVGKSTLFNRLCGKRSAIVHDLPGVTRDRKESKGNIGPLEFKIIDTAGLEQAGEADLATRMFNQTEVASNEADIILFLVDGRAGILPDDRFFAKWLRKKSKQVILVVNKSEGKNATSGISDAYSLGFDELVAISAEHGDGISDLYYALEKHDNNLKKEQEDVSTDKPLRIAIVGRPNAGKSTLINQFLGEERLLTGPEAGITRDSIEIDYRYKDRAIKLVDTAGMRRRIYVREDLEKLSFAGSRNAIKYAEIVVLVLDALAPFESQDIKIASEIIEEGRGIVIAFNKWDLVENKEEYHNYLRTQLDIILPSIKGVELIQISALTGQNIFKLLDAAFRADLVWNQKVNTAKLNDWLHNALEHHNLPLASNGRRIKVKYITQSKTRPPTFIIFSNYPAQITESYKKYLINSLRQYFKFPGTPIRIQFKKTANPYEDTDSK